MTEVKKLRFKTYQAIIRNSVGTRMFSEGYALVDGQTVNILKNGQLACAFFVSGVLCLFDVELIDHSHVTVDSTVKALERAGWKKVSPQSELQIGDIIVWRPKLFVDGQRHAHIGFALGSDQAISNDSLSGSPQKHSITTASDGSSWQVSAVYRGRHLFETSD